MRIDRLTLQNFRNYGQQSVDFSPGTNVIVGENAQGKTNLLEAVVYLSCGRSNRARTERELLHFGKTEALLRGELCSRERNFVVEARFAAGKRRKITVNQVPVKRLNELNGLLGTVFFCPEDLTLIREGAAARRRFMDQALCQLRPRYDAALSEYNRLYEHKTRILRDSEEHPSLLETLPEFNTRMAISGAVLIHYRARFCARLAEYAAAAHRECSGGREELSLRYETVKTVTEKVEIGSHEETQNIYAKYPKYFRKKATSGNKWSLYSAIIKPDADAIANIEKFLEMTADANGFNVSFGEWEEVTPTAIEEILEEAELNNEPVQKIHLNVVYNVKGQVVRTGNTSLEGLPKGLYIVNGKKYMVK